MSCLLYYITDRTQFPGSEAGSLRAVVGKIAEAAAAGVDYIQLREKDLSGRELETLASSAVRAIREQRASNDQWPPARLLINSRSDVALATGTDGVHLRGEDISVEDVRSVWAQVQARSQQYSARSPIVAVSCHTPADVIRAEAEGSDFTVFAPVFEKQGRSPVGLESLRQACRVKIPVLALGGVTLENAAACLEAGAAGIAGIRIFQENPIADVVRSLRRP